MQHPNPAANPFALLMNPEAVFQALEHTDQGRRPRGRICRPLDPPSPPQTPSEIGEVQLEGDDAEGRSPH